MTPHTVPLNLTQLFRSLTVPLALGYCNSITLTIQDLGLPGGLA